jgi:predicted dehydrogenase
MIPHVMNRRSFIFSSTAAMLSAPMAGYSLSSGSKIRIGMIGTRHAHASGKIKAIRDQSDTFELVGVVENDPVRRRELANDDLYSGVIWLTEEQLLNVKDLHVVAVETEVKQLVPTAMRCIEAGLHIHHDKPGGTSLPEFRKLLEKAEANGCIVQMGYMLRYNRAFQFMYHAVREGWLGNIMEIDSMMGKLANPSTRNDIGQFSGGGMFELGAHVIDSIIHMLGKPLSVTPFSHTTQPDGIADNQLAVLDFEQAIATVRINHMDPFGGPRRRFQISGDKGTIEIQQLESGDLTLYLDEPHGRYQKGEQQVSLGQDGRYDGEFRDLAKVIRGEKPFDWSYEHDLHTHEALLRASGMSTG